MTNIGKLAFIAVLVLGAATTHSTVAKCDSVDATTLLPGVVNYLKAHNDQARLRAAWVSLQNDGKVLLVEQMIHPTLLTSFTGYCATKLDAGNFEVLSKTCENPDALLVIKGNLLTAAQEIARGENPQRFFWD